MERHAADGGEGPEETLRQKRADRRQNEGAVPGRDTSLYSFFLIPNGFCVFFSCHSDAVNEAAPNQKRNLHLNFSNQRRFII